MWKYYGNCSLFRDCAIAARDRIQDGNRLLHAEVSRACLKNTVQLRHLVRTRVSDEKEEKRVGGFEMHLLLPTQEVISKQSFSGDHILPKSLKL